MDKTKYNAYVAILETELVPALGCTEPIAIAFAAAKAAETLGKTPDTLDVLCSGNIVKNVKGVTVPNSGGMMGIAAAASLGAIGGDASRQLEVLQGVNPQHIQEAAKRLEANWCHCGLAEGVENLYIKVKAEGGGEEATVELRSGHTHITEITKNGEVLFSQSAVKDDENTLADKNLLTVRDIVDFANEVALADVQEVLNRQVELNTAIAEEGLRNPYGMEIGRTMMAYYNKDDVRVRARAMAAAASDARMGGCALPVVINSGSGNQGATVSLPVIEYAKYLKVPHEKLLRALVVANLIAILQKRYIGNLSAYCGAVSAAAGAACGIIYLYDSGYEEISRVITNTLANVGGIVCDGAKASCAAKISSAVDAGILAGVMAGKNKDSFSPGQGLVKDDVEKTIASFGRMGREGMKGTDTEILNIMLEP